MSGGDGRSEVMMQCAWRHLKWCVVGAAWVLVGLSPAGVVTCTGCPQDARSQKSADDEFESVKASEWGKRLASRVVNERKQAVYALWVLGARGASEAPRLAVALQDSDEYVRSTAGKALERMGTSAAAAMSVLIDLLSAENDDLRSAAARLCGVVGAPPEDQIPRLVQAAKSEYDAVKAGVAVALGNAPAAFKGVRSTLDGLLEEPAEEVRRSAALGLARLDPVAAIRDGRELVRVVAIALQQRPGPRDPAIAAALVEAVRDGEEEVRARAASSLGMPGALTSENARTEVVHELLKALGRAHETPAVRAQLIYALGRAALWKPEALGAVIKAVDDEDGDVRFAACIAVGWSNTAGEPAVRVLTGRLADTDARVRAAAVRSLVALAPQEGTAKAIEGLLWDEDRMVRVATAESLGSLGMVAAPAIPMLTRCLKGQTDRATISAIGTAVLRIGIAPNAMLDELRKQFETSKRCPVGVALVLLRMEPEVPDAVVARIAEALLSELEHSSALNGIGHVGPRCAMLVEPLGEGLKSHDRQIRMMATRALMALRAEAPEAGALLNVAAGDPDPEVRDIVNSAVDGDKR